MLHYHKYYIHRGKVSRWGRALVFTGLFVIDVGNASDNPAELASATISRGREIYEYYCYQCHGYSGNANTLAASYLQPRPRDFTATRATDLSTGQMTSAVADGRPGTAMAGFGSVLSDTDIRAVVAYVRKSFMAANPLHRRYHTDDNGWPDHERYAAAFPFVDGSIPLDTAWEALEPEQADGKRLYLSTCISCHDPASAGNDGITWELRAVSYPRRHFSNRSGQPDLVSAASPYALHDVPVTPNTPDASVQRGMALYRENCAFCHAADGTGRNWIGSFLEPRPRDFTATDFRLADSPAEFRERLRNGLDGSSMPAWRYVLTDQQIDDILHYIQLAFATD